MPDGRATERGALCRADTGCCLVCGRSHGAMVMRESGYVGRACDCGTIYIDPVPRDDEWAPTTDAHLEAYYAIPAERRLAWAATHQPTGRFLEVGCGSGALVRLAVERGYDVEAVEPNAACAALVRRRFGIPVEEALIEDSALPSATFDLIYHVDLLSHFPDPVRALRSMGRLLAPGGTMCFEVGLFAGLDPRWYPWVGRPHFPAHRWFYDQRGVEQVLDRAGFDVVAVRTFAIAAATVVSSSLRRLLPGRLEAVPANGGRGDEVPARGSATQRAYARLQCALRYQAGAVIPFPGPRTAFVAARLRGGAP